MDTVSIRGAGPEDQGALEEIAVAAYEPYLERMGGLRPAPLDADYAAAISRDVVWVAEVDDRVVGFVVLVDEAEVTLIENVAVHPDGQGQSIGRRLMAIAEDHAKATEKKSVRLYTHSTMRENRRLYARLGYVETEQRVEDEFDRVFFEKRLD